MKLTYKSKVFVSQSNKSNNQTIYVIFELNHSKDEVEKLMESMFNPAFNIPIQPISELDFCEHYISPVTTETLKIEIKSGQEIILEANDVYLSKKFDMEELLELGVRNLKELKKQGVLFEVLFTHAKEVTKTKVVYYLPGWLT